MGKIRYLQVKLATAIFAGLLFLGMNSNAYPAELLNDPGFELSAPNGTFPSSGYWKSSWLGGTAGAVCTSTAASSSSCGLWAYPRILQD